MDRTGRSGVEGWIPECNDALRGNAAHGSPLLPFPRGLQPRDGVATESDLEKEPFDQPEIVHEANRGSRRFDRESRILSFVGCKN